MTSTHKCEVSFEQSNSSNVEKNEGSLRTRCKSINSKAIFIKRNKKIGVKFNKTNNATYYINFLETIFFYKKAYIRELRSVRLQEGFSFRYVSFTGTLVRSKNWFIAKNN